MCPGLGGCEKPPCANGKLCKRRSKAHAEKAGSNSEAGFFVGDNKRIGARPGPPARISLRLSLIGSLNCSEATRIDKAMAEPSGSAFRVCVVGPSSEW